MSAPVSYFSPNQQTSNVYGAFTADFNGDGALDIVAFDYANDAVIPWLNLGTGQFNAHYRAASFTIFHVESANQLKKNYSMTEFQEAPSRLLPGKQILHYSVDCAERMNADLIIMGTPEHASPVSHYSRGIVSAVAGSANCTVLVLPNSSKIRLLLLTASSPIPANPFGQVSLRDWAKCSCSSNWTSFPFKLDQL